MSKNIYKEWEKSGELEKILRLVKKWREDGAEMEEIADKLGISKTSLYKYQNENSEFANALKRGKEIIDAEVEESLKKECVGYFYEETITTKTAVIDKRTGQITDLERIETKVQKKYARPSPTAIAYYLNNRVSDRWKNRIVTVAEDANGIDESIREMNAYFEENKQIENEK